MVGLVGLVRPMGMVGLVNLVGLVGLVDLAGLVVPALFGGCYGYPNPTRYPTFFPISDPVQSSDPGWNSAKGWQ